MHKDILVPSLTSPPINELRIELDNEKLKYILEGRGVIDRAICIRRIHEAYKRNVSLEGDLG